ncbi:phytanoyl-CoA dioxygenase family protein [Pseudomonas agarici]|uniref:phytanoyl-CoA dioxygenase family protein n=2 Tax=Pseudomonas agarici TaxID=46677 RepID=UPI0008D02286|nr:phytanoyl-CoA dioxygenase family protein [Pseudomonas agarici]NWC08299.1 phytanoyl-CoA dioxygenase family protein [Pseudomonas agarici]SEL86907.1 Ectoine hydroxylase-related dioxygenase, phytanoyl-CoA dioxygenase (PhyH) family [Pseudomonas agarici]
MSKNIVKKFINRVYPLRHFAFFSQRLLTNPRHRELASKIACRRLPQSNLSSKNYSHDVELLQDNGYLILENLVLPSEIVEMTDWFSKKLTMDRYNAAAGYFEPTTPPPSCHTASFSTEDILRSPFALKWANNEKILSIVESTLGAKATLSNVSVWWSYPGHDTPQEAENFHRDVDDLRFIKLFIYLTDVDTESGPHAFVPKSQRHMGYRKIRRYSDQEITSEFGENSIKYFTGGKGTAFLENTFGLHKGQLPSKKRRLLFQAQYSLHPIGISTYKAISLTNSGPEEFDKYTNRLYIK